MHSKSAGADAMEAARPLLLAFASPAREAAFEKRFHTARLPLDRVHLATIMTCNLALVLLKIAPHGRWGAVALLLVDALSAALLLAWQCASRESYLRHRSPLIAMLHLVHAMISMYVQPMSPTPTCVAGSTGLLSGLRFWVVEMLHQLVPWTAIFACVLPLPIKHAIWSQAATVGMLLLPPFASRRRRVSLQLCATSGARYGRAAAWLSAALTLVLPPPMVVWVVAPKPLPDAAAFYMMTSMAQVVCSLALPLCWLARREWRARVLFARSQRDAAGLASLHQRARQWRLGAIEWGALVAALWCCGLAGARAAVSRWGALDAAPVTP